MRKTLALAFSVIGLAGALIVPAQSRFPSISNGGSPLPKCPNGYDMVTKIPAPPAPFAPAPNPACIDRNNLPTTLPPICAIGKVPIYYGSQHRWACYP